MVMRQTAMRGRLSQVPSVGSVVCLGMKLAIICWQCRTMPRQWGKDRVMGTKVQKEVVSRALVFHVVVKAIKHATAPKAGKEEVRKGTLSTPPKMPTLPPRQDLPGVSGERGAMEYSETASAMTGTRRPSSRR